jgi:hypothetical protein
VVGVVASIVRGTGVDAGVVEEERLVTAESVAASAKYKTTALEARGIASETPRLIDEVSGVVDEEVARCIGIGSLRTDFVAEMISRIEVVQCRVVAYFAEGLRRAGKAPRATATRK